MTRAIYNETIEQFTSLLYSSNADEVFEAANVIIHNEKLLNALKKYKCKELRQIFQSSLMSFKSKESSNVQNTLSIIKEIMLIDNMNKVERQTFFHQYIQSYKAEQRDSPFIAQMIEQLFDAPNEQHFLFYNLYQYRYEEMLEYVQKEFIHFNEQNRKNYINHLLQKSQLGAAVVNIIYNAMGRQYLENNLHLYLEGNYLTEGIGNKFIEYSIDIRPTQKRIIEMTAMPEELEIINNVIVQQEIIKQRAQINSVLESTDYHKKSPKI